MDGNVYSPATMCHVIVTIRITIKSATQARSAQKF